MSADGRGSIQTNAVHSKQTELNRWQGEEGPCNAKGVLYESFRSFFSAAAVSLFVNLSCVVSRILCYDGMCAGSYQGPKYAGGETMRLELSSTDVRILIE